MTVLSWGDLGQRFYETGVDRGVLYVGSNAGVAWSGLISVEESPTGGSPLPYYFDGYKYLNIATAEEFEATINAFSSPPEFDLCDGTGMIHSGLFVTQQPRKPFNFSYRTKIGNDVDGLDLGYKIHLVYNALSGPTSRANGTLNDSTSAMTLSWSITTAPPPLLGFRPSAHLVLDSRTTADALMSEIEDILYGTETSSPRMPSPQELSDLFTNNVPLLITDLGSGEYRAEGYGVNMVPGVDSVNFTIEDNSVTEYGEGFFTIDY